MAGRHADDDATGYLDRRLIGKLLQYRVFSGFERPQLGRVVGQGLAAGQYTGLYGLGALECSVTIGLVQGYLSVVVVVLAYTIGTSLAANSAYLNLAC